MRFSYIRSLKIYFSRFIFCFTAAPALTSTATAALTSTATAALTSTAPAALTSTAPAALPSTALAALSSTTSVAHAAPYPPTSATAVLFFFASVILNIKMMDSMRLPI